MGASTQQDRVKRGEVRGQASQLGVSSLNELF